MEILKLCDVSKIYERFISYSNDHITIVENRKTKKLMGIVLGTYILNIEPDTTLISSDSLEMLYPENQELYDFLLFDRDISLWTEEFIFYMILKFELVRE